jgi:hypothetical protein
VNTAREDRGSVAACTRRHKGDGNLIHHRRERERTNRPHPHHDLYSVSAARQKPFIVPIDSATNRRATKPSTWADARSSHCSSDKWLRLRSVGKQVQDGQPDRERYRSGAHAERNRQGITMRDR